MQIRLLCCAICFFVLPGFNNQHVENNSGLAGTETSEQASRQTILEGPEQSWVKLTDLAPVPEDVQGLIYFRRNALKVHLDSDGQYTYLNQRAKILDSRALDAGNVALVWNPEAGQPVVHRLRIYRGNDVVNVLDENRFEVIRREDLLEQSILTGFLTAVLRVPDLRVGDELEFAYTIPSQDPTLGNKSYGLLAVAAIPLSGQHTIGISWEDKQEPNIKLTDDIAKFEKKTSNSISVTLDGPEPISMPQDAPLRYGWKRVMEFSDFETWRAVSQYFGALFDDASNLSSNSAIKDEAKRIRKAYSDELEQAKAALKLVQQQVRYIYTGLNGGNITPATADETWQRRYGDCKGKSALLMALLRELGIESEVVLVNNAGADDGLDKRLPNPLLFDHAVLRAEINGAYYWLDATLPDVIEASARPFLPYRWVLPLSADGSSLVSTDNDFFELPQEMGIMEYDARAGFDEPARKVWTTVKRGVLGLTEYLQYSAMPTGQLETAIRNAMTGASEWDVIDNISYRYDRDTQASILTITGAGPIDWDRKTNGRFDLSLPGGGFSPPSKRQRSSEEDETLPFYSAPIFSCYATTVRLPSETSLENWGFNSTFDTEIFGRTYYRMMERRDDRTIRMVRASRVKQTEISPETALRDNNRIEDFDNSKANIRYTPNSYVMLRFSKSVPATYEIDWTGADPPCLPDVKQ